MKSYVGGNMRLFSCCGKPKGQVSPITPPPVVLTPIPSDFSAVVAGAGSANPPPVRLAKKKVKPVHQVAGAEASQINQKVSRLTHYNLAKANGPQPAPAPAPANIAPPPSILAFLQELSNANAPSVKRSEVIIIK